MTQHTDLTEPQNPMAKVDREGDLVRLTVGSVVATMTPHQADVLADALRDVSEAIRR